MKQRLLYITLSFIVLLPALSLLLPGSAVDATSATTYTGSSPPSASSLASTYCKGSSNSNCPPDFEQGYNNSSQGSSEGNAYCDEQSGSASKIGPNPSSVAACGRAYTAGVSYGKAASYCNANYSGLYSACLTVYVAGYGSSSSGSNYCKKSPNGFSVSTCETIYKAGYSKITTNPQGGGASGGSGSSTGASCADGFSLAWILCSVISGAAHFVTGIYTDIINPLLDQPQSSMLLNTSKPYYMVWSNFRIYGNIVLVIALLVIVFGESIGGGLIDAYSAKKILPRLLVSAVLINLSIYLVSIAVDITSVLGHGIYDLFVLPFHSGNISGLGLHLNTTGSILSVLGLGSGAIWVATAGGGFLHFLFVTLLGGGSLLLVAVMLTLVLRIALILGLIFVSPVAFALYCLPNTEQYFRKWWDLLFRALLVYPIVGAVFALANITALTLSNLPLGGIAQGFAQVLALLGLFAPLILVPFAFRMAGGAIGAIHQGVHSKTAAPGLRGVAGIRGRRRQTLHERRMNAQDRMGTGRTGSLYRGFATLGTREGWTPTGRGRRRFTEYNRRQFEKAGSKMIEEGGARAFNDDDASAAAVTATSANDFIRSYESMGHSREEAQEALGRVEVATGTGMGSDAMSAAALRYRISMSNTAYDAGAGGLDQMRTEVESLVQRGSITSHDAAGWMKANRGRGDFSANAYQSTVDFLEGRQSSRQQIEGAYNGADPRDILGGHQRAVETFAEQAALNLPMAFASGNQSEIDKAMADAANIHSVLSSVSPVKADEFADRVFGQAIATNVPAAYIPAELTAGLPAGTLPSTTYREYLDRLRSDPTNHHWFHDRTREYASASSAAAAAAAGASGAPPPTPPPSTTGGPSPSDRRLKRNITYLKTLQNGIRLYSFRYVWGGPIYVGVMAQDLLKYYPETVSKGIDGYYLVNYSLLGISMMTLEEYQEKRMLRYK